MSDKTEYILLLFAAIFLGLSLHAARMGHAVPSPLIATQVARPPSAPKL